jgi:hypothetical protein
MEGMEDQRGLLGTKSKCSPRPPPDIHITFGQKMDRDHLQRLPRPHTDSVWDVRYMVGKKIS